MKSLRIATRKSVLALWQSEYVATLLRQTYPNLQITLLPLSTRGDEILDRSLAAIGGKGLFLKELEHAMLRGEADCAVHSLKDVPMELEAPFVLPAVLPRADYADALVSNHFQSLDDLPYEARVGTSSLRRQAQLRAVRPDVQQVDLRGNVHTRLKKLDAGEFDAIILACAGLERLQLGARIQQRLAAPSWLPAPAQGAIAVECRGDTPEIMAALAVLNDPHAHACTDAERAMNRALEGSCHVPVGALAQWQNQDNGKLYLQGLVGRVTDGKIIRSAAAGSNGEALGLEVAQQLLEKGAAALLGH